MKTVLIFGSFDLIHPGHLFLIHEAQQYGEVHAVVALDETIIKIKGARPFNNLKSRLKNLETWGVHPHAGDSHDRLRAFKELKPEYIMLGYDQFVFVDQLQAHIKEHALETEIITLQPFKETIFKSKIIRRGLEDPNAGFLLIDKPSGEPSLRTVGALRKITNIKQIGFAGTLDPLASGLLVCGISNATSLLDWWHVFPKTYEAEVILGSTSDTYDTTGIVTKVSDTMPSSDELTTTVRSFVGSYEQEPPVFSAKKIQGTRAYKLARTGTKPAMKKNNVVVFKLSVLEYQFPKLRFLVRCSSGTYVRSLVHDIGIRLRTGAVMSGLRRTAIGSLALAQSNSVTQLTHANWKNYLISVELLQKEMNMYMDEQFVSKKQ